MIHGLELVGRPRNDGVPWCSRSGGAWLGCVGSCLCSGSPPKVHDDRFQIERVAESPDLVAPIGLAIDAQGRLCVLESHTHHPPADYEAFPLP